MKAIKFSELFINKYSLALLAIACLFFTTPSYARECRDTDTVYRYAKRNAYKVAEHYNGTKNVRVNVASCDYDPYDEYYTISMYTYWDGSLSGDLYNVDGILKVKLDGSVISYKTTYVNEKVKNWKGTKTFVGFLGAILENSSDYSR